MSQKIIYILSCALIIFSCTKKTEVKGRAFSRYYYPLSNNDIKLYTTEQKSSKFIKIITTTDAEGYYSFSYRTKNKLNYVIQVVGDSGNSNGISLKNGKTHEINLIIGQ